jgi:hypothetical protein
LLSRLFLDHVLISYSTAAPSFTHPISSITSIPLRSIRVLLKVAKNDQQVHIRPEDGTCNIYRNFGQLFNSRSGRSFSHWLEARKLEKKSTKMKLLNLGFYRTLGVVDSLCLISSDVATVHQNVKETNYSMF